MRIWVRVRPNEVVDDASIGFDGTCDGVIVTGNDLESVEF